MSSNPMTWEGGINPGVKQFPKAASCLMPMGVTSENVAEKFGVDRKTQVDVIGPPALGIHWYIASHH